MDFQRPPSCHPQKATKTPLEVQNLAALPHLTLRLHSSSSIPLIPLFREWLLWPRRRELNITVSLWKEPLKKLPHFAAQKQVRKSLFVCFTGHMSTFLVVCIDVANVDPFPPPFLFQYHHLLTLSINSSSWIHQPAPILHKTGIQSYWSGTQDTQGTFFYRR